MNSREPPADRAGSPGARLLKKAIAGAAVAAATELFGARAYIAYEAFRRLSSPGQRTDEESGLPANPEQMVEAAVGGAIEHGKRVFVRHRPVLDRARAWTRGVLREPRLRGAVVGGSVVGAATALGALPLAIGAGAAYLAYRKRRHDRRRGNG
jgi:hypothetical protein